MFFITITPHKNYSFTITYLLFFPQPDKFAVPPIRPKKAKTVAYTETKALAVSPFRNKPWRYSTPKQLSCLKDLVEAAS